MAHRPPIMLFLGALLLLLGAAALFSADWHLLDTTRPLAAADRRTPVDAATQPGVSHAPTAVSSVSSVAPYTTPTGGPSATATLSSTTPTVTPSAQPVLTVIPTHITFPLCSSSTARFSVKNGGGGVLQWTATASNVFYRLFPTSGTLGGGQQQTVTVSNITSSGQVMVAAPRAANAPQSVTITCG